MSPNIRSSRKKNITTPAVTPSAEVSAETSEMNTNEKLKLIDEELLAFHEYCKNAGFTDDEMRQICEPLISSFRRVQLRRILKMIVVIIVLCLIFYGLWQISPLALHFTAFGRIFLIKMLPIWDWTNMFYESCLIDNPLFVESTFNQQDCVSCEALENIDRLSITSYQQVLDGYLERGAPVIVQDAMDTWPVMNMDEFWFDNITKLYLQDEKLRDTVPCVMASNLRTGYNDMFLLLSKIQNPKIGKWFVHWQNCALNAVKVLRKYYQRPYFLANTVSPAHFNWVFMSSDYHAKIYKKIELDTGLIQLAQLRGSTLFRLKPHKACNESCTELLGELNEGEMLVFTNYIWKFEYLPAKGLDNIAILTETIWDENSFY